MDMKQHHSHYPVVRADAFGESLANALKEIARSPTPMDIFIRCKEEEDERGNKLDAGTLFAHGGLRDSPGEWRLFKTHDEAVGILCVCVDAHEVAGLQEEGDKPRNDFYREYVSAAFVGAGKISRLSALAGAEQSVARPPVIKLAPSFWQQVIDGVKTRTLRIDLPAGMRATRQDAMGQTVTLRKSDSTDTVSAVIRDLQMVVILDGDIFVDGSMLGDCEKREFAVQCGFHDAQGAIDFYTELYGSSNRGKNGALLLRCIKWNGVAAKAQLRV